MYLSASLAQQKALTTLEFTRHNSWRRDNKNETVDSVPDTDCSVAMRSFATDFCWENRRQSAGVHSHGQQRQDRSPLGLSRKVCGPRVAQQRVPLRRQALQQRQYAKVTKRVAPPRRRFVKG